ncbi:hypothetical protein BD410DRAFT_804659 [Rickenella mellea]|uniref:3'-5' exonuclease domain-containing protein n=1 Tax=Rickenella mellea TaxID=50990 RepID=A0A4Y7Q2J0_9AGAM|nr:hypothetical protein BD410DRAFT_804659 [Rickenella mellea]
MSKLDGVPAFAGLFTIVNELEQIRYQAFVPTKSLQHVRAAFEGIAESLKKHGHPETYLGFTDNVPTDAPFVTKIMPSLARNVVPVLSTEFSDLPAASLLEHIDVLVLDTFEAIESACLFLLDNVKAEDKKIFVGFDTEWNFIPDSQFGRNVGLDLSRLASDWNFKLPDINPKRSDRFKNPRHTYELGAFARIKGVVKNGPASLATIAAATLHVCLSKIERASDWQAPELSDSQKHYAASDSWISLEIYKTLNTRPSVGISLSHVSVFPPTGYKVSIMNKKKEVAQGTLGNHAQHFDYIDKNGEKKQLNVTKTRAIVQIESISAPGWILPFHGNISLGSIETLPFLTVLNKTTLFSQLNNNTYDQDFDLSSTGIPDIPSTVRKPSSNDTHSSIPDQSSDDELDNEEEFSDADDNFPDLESDDNNVNFNNGNGNQNVNLSDIDMSTAYSQPQDLESPVPSRILADVWHIMDRILRLIPQSHSLRQEFSSAFSETILVPDREDKARMEAFLKKQNLT